MAEGISLPLRVAQITRVPAWHRNGDKWGSRERASIELSGHGSKIALSIDADVAEAAGMMQIGREYHVIIEPAPMAAAAASRER